MKRILGNVCAHAQLSLYVVFDSLMNKLYYYALLLIHVCTLNLHSPKMKTLHVYNGIYYA